MCFGNSTAAAALAAAALMMMVGGAAAHDETKYPDLKGQWRRAGTGGLFAGGAGGLRYDESKPPALTPTLGQEPPLKELGKLLFPMCLGLQPFDHRGGVV